MKFFKSLSLMLAMTFFIGTVVPAGAQANVGGLAEAVDRYNYAMNVEWDQQDMAFKDQAEMEFEKAMNEVSRQGVTAEEFQAFISGRIMDANARAEFNRLVATMKAQNLSEEEAAEVTRAFVEKGQAEGVNFMNGGRMHCKKWCKVVVVVIIVIVVRHMWRSHGKIEWAPVQ